MHLEVVVPMNRSVVLAPMLRCFAQQSVRPDMVTLVTNWPTDKMRDMVERALLPGKLQLNVRQLTFETSVYALGLGDAGLRRNMAIWQSDAKEILCWDDDQIPPRGTVEGILDRLARTAWVWCNHRFIDYASVNLDDLLDMPAERGRSREETVNFGHTFQSALGGIMGVHRQAYIELGGYDLIYTRGKDDTNLGQRVMGDGSLMIYEPPFAWHPLPTVGNRLPLDLLLPGNICSHHLPISAQQSMQNMVIKEGKNRPAASIRRAWAYAACTKCPWVEPHPNDPTEIVHYLGPVLLYDPKNVKIKYVELLGGASSASLHVYAGLGTDEVRSDGIPVPTEETVEAERDALLAAAATAPKSEREPVVEEALTEDALPCIPAVEEVLPCAAEDVATVAAEPEPEAAPTAVNRPVTWADLSDGTWPDGAAPPRRGLVFSIRGSAYKILERDAEGVWWVADVSHGDESKRFVLVASEWLQNQADGSVGILAPGDATDESWRTPVVSAPTED